MKRKNFFRKAGIAIILILIFILQIFMPIMKVEAATYYSNIDYRNSTIVYTQIFREGDVFIGYKEKKTNGEAGPQTDLRMVVINGNIIGNNISSYAIPADRQFALRFISTSESAYDYYDGVVLRLDELYIVTFDYNGGDGLLSSALLAGSNSGLSNAYGSMVSYDALKYSQDYQVGGLPTPTRDGYIFDGWYTAAEGGTQVTNSSTLTSGNITLYAHWIQAASYSVNDNLTYTGEEQTGITYDSDTTEIITGTYKATNAGDYAATLKPKEGYVWSDDRTTDAKVVNWSISPANITIKATNSTIRVGEEVPDLSSPILGTHYSAEGLKGSDTITTPPKLEYSVTPDNSVIGTYDIVPSNASAGGNYTITYSNGKLTIDKANPSVTAPTANTLTYSGADQQLVREGSTNDGTLYYVVTTENTAPGDGWETTVPKKTDAGTYYVWYKVVGDANHLDYVAQSPIVVNIAKRSIADATVTLSETKYLYDESPHGVAVSSVVLDGVQLTEGVHYSVSGTTSATDKNTYTVIVTALDNSNYTGETSADWSIGMETPVIVAPISTPITYGQTLGESILNGGSASFGDVGVDGSFSWKASTVIPSVSDSDTTLYEVIFNPVNTETYTTATCFITVTVNKAESPSENPAPTPKEDLTDNGHPQELINPVTVTGGTIEYVIGTDDSTPPTSGWGPNIPTAAAPGTYYVWYKVVGDENHQDSVPKCIIVTIAEALVPANDTPSGYVKDVTGTNEASGNYTFGQRIVNNGDLKTLLSLSDDEVSQGTKVWLDVVNLGNNAPDSDKALVEAAKGDYTIGTYLDINLYKKVGNNEAVKVTKTNGNVEVSLVMPENLRNEGRAFGIFRVHDDMAALISASYAGDSHALTFKTDGFSTYAIVYKDGTNAGSNGGANTNASTNSNPSTGAATNIDTSIPKTDGTSGLMGWYLALIISSATLGVLTVVSIKNKDRKKINK